MYSLKLSAEQFISSTLGQLLNAPSVLNCPLCSILLPPISMVKRAYRMLTQITLFTSDFFTSLFDDAPRLI
jgi:hypothetical protein